MAVLAAFLGSSFNPATELWMPIWGPTGIDFAGMDTSRSLLSPHPRPLDYPVIDDFTYIIGDLKCLFGHAPEYTRRFC